MLTAKQHAAVKKYRATPKGKAAARRYRNGPKGRAKQAKYEGTPKGQAARARVNARRLHVGGRYAGVARTAAEAVAINAHIKRRLHGFIQRQQDRTQAEGV